MTTRTIDTNVLVRLLVDDHSEQAIVAGKLAERFQLVVLPTVMLETEWVLRSRFHLDRSQVLELLRRVVDFERFIVIGRQDVVQAIDAFAEGMDFADAMHVCFVSAGDFRHLRSPPRQTFTTIHQFRQRRAGIVNNISRNGPRS